MSYLEVFNVWVLLKSFLIFQFLILLHRKIGLYDADFLEIFSDFPVV